MNAIERKVLGNYIVKPRQPKNSSYRAYLLFKLERDWPILRHGLKNGRKLNRLSTRQLEAKARRMARNEAQARKNYVAWLDSFMGGRDPIAEFDNIMAKTFPDRAA